MQNDMFASLRKRDTGVSTVFTPPEAKHPQHCGGGNETPENPQKSAVETPKHLKHPEKADGEDFAGFVSVEKTLPADWGLGLDKLKAMDVPIIAERERWRQIVLDAQHFARDWHAEAIQRSWSIGAVFGFDPKEPFQDDAGLIFSIRGDQVVDMYQDERGRGIVAMRSGDARRYYYQRPFDHLSPIWALGSPVARR